MHGPVHGHDPARRDEEAGGFQGAFLSDQFGEGMRAPLAGARVDIHDSGGRFALVKLEVEFDPDHAGCNRCQGGPDVVPGCGLGQRG